MRVKMFLKGLTDLMISALYVLNYFNFCLRSVISCPFAETNNFLPNSEQNIGDKCNPPQHECDPSSVYYTIDGSCNNLESTFWGEAKMPYARLVRANFSDGFCSLRIGSDGDPMPPARKIRTTLLTDLEKPSSNTNILFNGFGQWFTHDVTRMIAATSTQKCCDEDNPDICLPLRIPSDDKFYSSFDQTCIEQTRAINTHQQGCKVSPCLPINFQTGVLDLSILYGPDEGALQKIRSFQSGELLVDEKLEKSLGAAFPAVTTDIKNNCPLGGIDANSCMITGDPRINLNPELTMMEIIFLRAHNNIAAALLKYNHKWDDEKAFQEARRLLIAIYQHIIFSELIPLYIGTKVAKEYDLLPASKGHVKKYDASLNPQTIVEYAFAVGRSHHSMTTGSASYKDSKGKSISYLLRDKYFNQKFLLEKSILTNLMEAYYTENSNRQSEHFSEEVTNFLFFAPGGNSGSDLPSTDINRGLDVGLPPYNAMRAACGLKRFANFGQLGKEIKNSDVVPKLKELYPSVEDLDFYVGGLFERPLSGAIVGPTFACVIAEAAHRWKCGDRLHYQFPQAKFKQSQLKTIRSVTFASLLCLANPDLKTVPKHAFLASSYYNPLMSCDEVPEIDFFSF